MRTKTYLAADLEKLLRKQKIATMEELKRALGTDAVATVFRRLGELPYRTSYSHRGGYYTLSDIPEFDEWGLWSFREAWFSRRGTLLATAAGLVEEAEAGFYAQELERLLNVEVKVSVLKLLAQERLVREKVAGRYLYCSPVPAKARQQVSARRVLESESPISGRLPHVETMPDELKAAIILFYSVLDEKQRRLYAGLEALKMGHGGDRRIADLLGLDAGTVARGRRELLERDVEVGRTRRLGGGRKPLEKKLPKLSRQSSG
jgi:hypothetical protein